MKNSDNTIEEILAYIGITHDYVSLVSQWIINDDNYIKFDSASVESPNSARYVSHNASEDPTTIR